MSPSPAERIAVLNAWKSEIAAWEMDDDERTALEWAMRVARAAVAWREAHWALTPKERDLAAAVDDAP